MNREQSGFSELAQLVRAEVDAELRQVFAARLEQCRELGTPTLALIAALRDLTLRGGKRLRPIVLTLGHCAARPEAGLRPAIVAGAAFELLQSYFLIHDDWMDGDQVRRGGPTAHVALAARLGNRQLGDACAILAGDYAVALAQELMASAVAAAQCATALDAMTLFARIQADTICGQALDLAADRGCVNGFRLEDLKTGSYTVRGPLSIGATLGGANAALLEACDNFARPLGIAFQLRDDVVGLLGEPTTTGKAQGADIRAGKRTAIILDALENSDAGGRARLQAALGTADLDHDELASATRIVVASGAIERAEATIRQLTRQALEFLEPEAGFSAQSVACLTELASRLTDRCS